MDLQAISNNLNEIRKQIQNFKNGTTTNPMPIYEPKIFRIKEEGKKFNFIRKNFNKNKKKKKMK